MWRGETTTISRDQDTNHMKWKVETYDGVSGDNLGDCWTRSRCGVTTLKSASWSVMIQEPICMEMFLKL